MTSQSAEIGVFGGSGFTSLLDDGEDVAIDTPYGPPSACVTIGTIAGRRVAFMPRHGAHHEFPPHRINYRANVWAMHALGVRWLLGPCASGSLQLHIGLGDFVVCDQFVDRTSGRADTFYDGPVTTHVTAADPYSPVLRGLIVEGCRDLGITVHETGTVVVIQGPRFSTRAESRWFTSMGWDVVNMTGYPEAWLARELAIAYANVSLITDHDVGLEGMEGVEPVTRDEVFRVFNENNARVRALVAHVIPRIPTDPDPHAASALDGAR